MEKIVKFDDWSGGDFGVTPPWQTAHNQWTGLNCIVFENGTIGPRPGLKAVSMTAMAQDSVIVGMGFAGTPGSNWWTAMTDQLLWTFSPTSSTPSWLRADLDEAGASGDFDAVPTNVEGLETASNESYLMSDQDGLYRVIHENGPNTTMTRIVPYDTVTAYEGQCITKYKNWLVTADTNKIWFSDRDDFGAYTPTSYYTIGYGPEVAWLGWTKDALLIVMADSGIWEFRGLPGEKATIRRLYAGGRHPWSFSPGRMCVLPNDDVWFVPIDRDFPVRWSGSQIQEMDHLKIFEGDYSGATGDIDEVRIVPTDEDDECLVLFKDADAGTSKKRALLKRSNTWTRIEWDSTNSEVAALGTYAATDRQGLIYISPTTAVGASGASLYSYDSNLERPGFASDGYASTGDGTAAHFEAWFETGEWWAPEGQEVTIKNIIVDFVKWNTGYGSFNVMNFDLYQLSSGENAQAAALNLQGFSESRGSAVTTLAGKRDRFILGGMSGGGIPSSGFKLRVHGIVGCAVQSIRIVLDQNPATPRY